MKVNVQKRLIASIVKSSKKRVKFNPLKLEEIKEGITKADLRGIISSDAVTIVPKRGVSKGRARKVKAQKKKGLRRGSGSRKGTINARENQKTVWIKKIRLQRGFIKELKEKNLVSNKNYRELYMKAKGGFFRSKRHIKLFITEQGMIIENGKEKN